jgi:uncharacterized small protein (DUF1192 family)
MSQEITAEDLLRKIGALVVQLDVANARIEMLAKEIEKLQSEKKPKSD